jgi:hypothetical protein
MNMLSDPAKRKMLSPLRLTFRVTNLFLTCLLINHNRKVESDLDADHMKQGSKTNSDLQNYYRI